MAQIKVGAFDIVAIQDMPGEFPPDAMFPGVPLEAWAPYRSLYASTFGDGVLTLNIGAYVIQGGERIVLVDTGLGPNVIPGRPGRLVPNLEATGIKPDAVDTVIFTHLHGDHVGWNFQDGVETFPRARYVVQQADWDHFSARQDDAGVQAQVLPLQKTGRLELVSGETQFMDAITLHPTPGHTPGHQSVIVSSRGERALIAGDVSHHPAQAHETDWSPSFDIDGSGAAVTRKRIMEMLEQDGTRACFGHYPAPGFGLILREDGRRIFRAL